MNSLIKITILIAVPLIVGLMMPERNASNADSLLDGNLVLNPGHLDGPFTGGFGEQTCHSCHFDYNINMHDRGGLNLKGFGKPSGYEAGKKYNLSLTIHSDHLEIGGFQMTARYEDGTQAGNFNLQSDRLMFTPNIDSKVRYLQHSGTGTTPTSDRAVTWSFQWIAPENGDQPVHLHIAANAGNDDDSAFGDWIYTKELVLQPLDGNQ